jgi:hypothetical protein
MTSTEPAAEGTTAKARAPRTTSATRATTRRPRSPRATAPAAGITVTAEETPDTGAGISITTDAAEVAEAAGPRPRGCAGCAERDARVERLGADLGDTLEAVETRVFTFAGVALGVGLAALVIAFVALGYARRAGQWQGEIPAWDE